MTFPANGQLSLIQCVPASSCVATLASSPNRSPVSARAASGAARNAAARTSFFTVGLRDGPYSLDHPTHGTATFQSRPPKAAQRLLLLGCTICLRRQLEHALHRRERAHAQLVGQRDLRLPIAHAEVELFPRVEAHVGTDAAIAPAARRCGDQLRIGARLRPEVKDS